MVSWGSKVGIVASKSELADMNGTWDLGPHVKGALFTSWGHAITNGRCPKSLKGVSRWICMKHVAASVQFPKEWVPKLSTQVNNNAKCSLTYY